jgi:hypothetical protein
MSRFRMTSLIPNVVSHSDLPYLKIEIIMKIIKIITIVISVYMLYLTFGVLLNIAIDLKFETYHNKAEIEWAATFSKMLVVYIVLVIVVLIVTLFKKK